MVFACTSSMIHIWIEWTIYASSWIHWFSKLALFLHGKQINSRPWYHSRPYKSRTLNFRRQKLSNIPLTSKYLAPEILALRYSCFTPGTWTEKGCFGNSIGFPSLWRKYALEAIIKLLFISLYRDKCLLFMLELY